MKMSIIMMVTVPSVVGELHVSACVEIAFLKERDHFPSNDAIISGKDDKRM